QLSEDFHIVDEINDSEILKDIETNDKIKYIVFEKVESLESILKKLERYPDTYKFGILTEKND
ncbi:MAG: hypothetical protein MHPSP_003497, partial [Paramarteilia canceri]